MVSLRKTDGGVELAPAYTPRFILQAAEPPRARSREPQVLPTLAAAFRSAGGRILLLGEPGSGKTTAILSFCRELAATALDDQTQPIPILASIRTWDGRSKLSDWIATLAPAEVLQQKIIYLLDGLDELGGARKINPSDENSLEIDPQKILIDSIRAGELATAQVVISCRSSDFRNLGHPKLAEAVELQPLSDQDVSDHLAQIGRQDLADRVRDDETLRRIARTPLVLGMLAAAGERATQSGGEWNLKRVISGYVELAIDRELLRAEACAENTDRDEDLECSFGREEIIFALEDLTS